jgi:hypothetical protein
MDQPGEMVVERRDSHVESFREEVVRQTRERQTSLSKVTSYKSEGDQP